MKSQLIMESPSDVFCPVSKSYGCESHPTCLAYIARYREHIQECVNSHIITRKKNIQRLRNRVGYVRRMNMSRRVKRAKGSAFKSMLPFPKAEDYDLDPCDLGDWYYTAASRHEASLARDLNYEEKKEK